MHQILSCRAVKPKYPWTSAITVVSACPRGSAQHTHLRLAQCPVVLTGSPSYLAVRLTVVRPLPSQDQQAVPMDTDEQHGKRTLSHWSTEEKEAFLACFKVRMPSAGPS